MNVSGGVIDKLVMDGEVDENVKPILQVMGYKKIPLAGAIERYRLLLSDGQQSYGFFVLATQQNDRLLAGELDAFTIIKLEQYAKCMHIEKKVIILLLDFIVLRKGSEIGQRLTNISDTLELDVPQELTNTGMHPILSEHEKSTSTDATFQQNGQSAPENNLPENNLAKRRMSRIEVLSPYQNRWTIRARVTHKTPVKKWTNQRGSGQFFSVDLVDETGEIRALGWNDQVEDWYNSFEVNKVYYISNAYLKHANRTFTSVKHDYEMTLHSSTAIQVCNEVCNSIPEMVYSFVPIASLVNRVKDSIVDLIGICISIHDVETVVGKTNLQQYLKRDIVLVDQTNTAVNVTLWAEEAEKFVDTNQQVVAIKGAKVTEFRGIGLGTIMTSVIRINPHIVEAHTLREWYDREGKNMQAKYLSDNGGTANWKTFSQVFHEKLGCRNTPDYYTTKATVVLMKKDNCLYRACSSLNCKKKVLEVEDGKYYCEKCNKNSTDFRWCLLLSIDLSDFSGNQRVTCFHETAEKILAKTSNEMGELRERDEDGFQRVFSEAIFRTYIFKLRSKIETFNDEIRSKTHVIDVTPMNYRSYCTSMLEELRV